MSIILTPGQAGDNPQLLPLLDQVAVGRDGPGRPRKRPERVLADKAYSHPSTRAAMRERQIAFTSPERVDQIERRRAKGSRGGRPPAFDPEIYADRNVVERCFNRLKQFRALATRYAKRVAYYRSEIIIAAIVLWLRADLQDTPQPPTCPTRTAAARSAGGRRAPLIAGCATFTPSRRLPGISRLSPRVVAELS